MGWWEIVGQLGDNCGMFAKMRTWCGLGKDQGRLPGGRALQVPLEGAGQMEWWELYVMWREQLEQGLGRDAVRFVWETRSEWFHLAGGGWV